MKARKLLSLALALVTLLALVSVPALAAGDAVPTRYTASVNGNSVVFPAYEVNGEVYVRLRDAAKTLNTFNVQWTSRDIVITTNTPYTSSVGTELAAPFSGNQAYVQSPTAITVDGAPVDLTGILLTDAGGNGYSYFTPKALETALGIRLSAPATAPWAATYAQQVKALAAENADTTYALIYVNEDDVPELVADRDGYYVKLYTYADGQVKEVFDWGYGAAGNGGYDYLPKGNTVYGSSTEYGGAIVYENYYKLGADGKPESIHDKSLSIWYFDDRNGNGRYDEGEENPDTAIYRYGDQTVTPEVYEGYAIEGDYETISGSMTAEQVLAALAGK